MRALKSTCHLFLTAPAVLKLGTLFDAAGDILCHRVQIPKRRASQKLADPPLLQTVQPVACVVEQDAGHGQATQEEKQLGKGLQELKIHAKADPPYQAHGLSVGIINVRPLPTELQLPIPAVTKREF